jgi:hypothetical protein
VPQFFTQYLFGGFVHQWRRQRDIGRRRDHVTPNVIVTIVQLTRERFKGSHHLQRLVGIDHVDQNGLFVVVGIAFIPFLHFASLVVCNHYFNVPYCFVVVPIIVVAIAIVVLLPFRYAWIKQTRLGRPTGIQPVSNLLVSKEERRHVGDQNSVGKR